MLVLAPSGNTYNVGLSGDTISRGAFATAAYPPTIGGHGLMYAVTAGNVNPFISQTFGTLLFQNDNGTTMGWEKLSTNSAVTTAISQIMGALAGGCAAGTFTVAGDFQWTAPAS